MFKFKNFIFNFIIVISLIVGIFIIFSDDFKYSNYSDDNSLEFTSKFTSKDIAYTDVDNDEEKKIVFDGLTIDELIDRLNRNLYNELSGKGGLYASYSLERGVDPYLAVAISLEETGCKWNCSSLVKYCNNVGGMIGNGCNGFSYWNSLDEGIKAFIDNISNNYVAYGLTDATSMNSKYAENPLWAHNVNNYINIIKNN